MEHKGTYVYYNYSSVAQLLNNGATHYICQLFQTLGRFDQKKNLKKLHLSIFPNPREIWPKEEPEEATFVNFSNFGRFDR